MSDQVGQLAGTAVSPDVLVYKIVIKSKTVIMVDSHAAVASTLGFVKRGSQNSYRFGATPARY